MTRWLLIGAACLWTTAANAAPPVVTEMDRFKAQQVGMMTDVDPTSRMLILLTARDFDDATLFALAASQPGLVEQLVGQPYRSAIDYIAQLPPGELYRVRGGETVVRTPSSMTSSERARINKIVEAMGYKPKRFEAVRIGPLEGRLYRFEVTVRAKRKQRVSESIELCWPSTPERDEDSRSVLSRHFGARPSAETVGASMTLRNSSFEQTEALASSWTLEHGIMLGRDYPINDIDIDEEVAIDGIRSLRFHASEETRYFQTATQQLAITPGVSLRLRAQVKADNLRIEFQQQPASVYLKLIFLDAAGFQVGTESVALARLETHAWEPLEILATAPENAEKLKVLLLSGVSGTAWFDGISIEVR